MRGTDVIIVSANPKGVFTEGTIEGTPKPGTMMQLKPGVPDVAGRFTYQAYDADATGNRRACCVLLEDRLQGRTCEDAYVDGDRAKLYYPIMGEELNLIAKDIAGTGDDITIGELFTIDDGTGKLVKSSGTPESEPFQSLEAVTDPVADSLVHVLFTGF